MREALASEINKISELSKPSRSNESTQELNRISEAPEGRSRNVSHDPHGDAPTPSAAGGDGELNGSILQGSSSAQQDPPSPDCNATRSMRRRPVFAAADFHVPMHRRQTAASVHLSYFERCDVLYSSSALTVVMLCFMLPQVLMIRKEVSVLLVVSAPAPAGELLVRLFQSQQTLRPQGSTSASEDDNFKVLGCTASGIRTPARLSPQLSSTRFRPITPPAAPVFVLG